MKKTSVNIAIRPNAFAILRVCVFSNTRIAMPANVLCTLPFSGTRYVMRVMISSAEEKDHAVKGRWFEHYLFFLSGILDTVISAAVEEDNLQISCDAMPAGIETLSRGSIVRFIDMLKHAATLHVEHFHEKIPVFYGIDTALNGVLALNNPKPSCPSLGHETFGLECQPQVACWGEGHITELLSSSLGYVHADESALPLSESGFFRLMLIDNSQFSPASDVKDAALSRALERSQSPAVFVESRGDMVRFRKHATGYFEECGIQELIKTAPSPRDSAALKTITVPCVSDCYQYPEFNLMIDDLARYGFSICAAEGQYFHIPQKTFELLSGRAGDNVKIYPRLSPEGMLSLFRQSGFVLFYPSTIRSEFQKLSLALLAVFSGSIPVYYGGKAPLSYAEILPYFYGVDALTRFLYEHDNILLFQKLWLSILRQVLALDKGGGLALLGEFAPPLWNVFPPVEMICVSKRPKNIPIISANFLRQKYLNINYHLIWNVNLKEKDYCINISKALQLKNLRISVVDEQFNIGACLNHGIQSSEAKYWFKIDDDNYYGKNYLVDMVNMYRLTDADVVFKPQSFLAFNNDSSLFIRHACIEKMLNWLKPNDYVCGATLSGKIGKGIPLFSVEHRNGCDSNWIERLIASKCKAFISDCYNFCNIRYEIDKHTWKVSHSSLISNASRLGNFDGEWLDAD